MKRLKTQGELSKMTPLQKARYKIKKSLTQVSQDTGISPQCISNYENFSRLARPPQAWTLIEYYEKFKIQLSLYDFYPKILFTNPEILEQIKKEVKKLKCRKK